MGEVVWGRQGTQLYFGTPRVRYGEFGTEYVELHGVKVGIYPLRTNC